MDGADEEAGGGEMKKNAWVWLAVAGLAVQAAGLGWLVARYERVVSKGVAVRVPCSAFDPKDVLRGRYLHVDAVLECGEAEGAEGGDWTFGWQERKRFYALLEEDGEGEASHRVAKVALSPGEDGMWVKVPDCQGTWNSEAKKHKLPVRVRFPGKLFMDERLAGEADRIFAERVRDAEGTPPIAVYRAWSGNLVLVDVELDGTSIRELARRAAKGETAPSGG